MFFHSWASFASCSVLKARVSKATKLRSQQGTCFSPCEAACVGTHVSARVLIKGECVCVFLHAEMCPCRVRPGVQGVVKGLWSLFGVKEAEKML